MHFKWNFPDGDHPSVLIRLKLSYITITLGNLAHGLYQKLHLFSSAYITFIIVLKE